MTSLTHRAEQALLGALLTSPDRPGGLPGVKLEDFTPGLHQHLFSILQHGATQRAAWLAAEVAGAEYLAELRRSCPDPAHAPAYARLVMEAALRRQLAQHALRLEYEAANLNYQAQRLADGARPGDAADELVRRDLLADDGDTSHEAVQRLFGHELQVAFALRAHATAFDPGRNSPGPVPPPDLTIDQPIRAAVTSPAIAAWQAADVVRPDQRDTHTQREELVLASIIQRHEQTRNLPRWLPAQAFTSTARQELFTAITSLRARGEPVDELTADWERARRYPHTGDTAGAGTSCAARLARLPATPAGALQAARQLFHDYANSAHARGQDVRHNLAPGPASSTLTAANTPALGNGTVPRPLLQPPDPPGRPGPTLRM
jgi:hypothetical protein